MLFLHKKTQEFLSLARRLLIQKRMYTATGERAIRYRIIWKELGAILARANPLIIITCPRADRFSEKPPPRLISCPNQQCSINQVARSQTCVRARSRKISAAALCISNKITLFTPFVCRAVCRRESKHLLPSRRAGSARLLADKDLFSAQVNHQIEREKRRESGARIDTKITVRAAAEAVRCT